MNATIYPNIIEQTGLFITIDKALERIRTGEKSYNRVMAIRACLSKVEADKIKATLPSVCFSGEFNERVDSKIIKHSGFIVLDFDGIENIDDKKKELSSNPFVYACWISPRGNGLKALVKIADGSKHRLHFKALQDLFPDIDKSGINEARVCYESFDPEIYINREASVFQTIKTTEIYATYEPQNQDDEQSFKNILKWITKKGTAFQTGERNIYIYKVASACCRFGISEQSAISLICYHNQVSSDFPMREMVRTVRSAYVSNKNKFATALMDKEILVSKTTSKEIDIAKELNPETESEIAYIIYGEYAKGAALDIFDFGFEKVLGVGSASIDYHYKSKKGELNLLSGIGNYGKSAYIKMFYVLRAIMHGEKTAIFAPEDVPVEEFYHELVEMLLGCDCTPANPNQPSRETYIKAYDFISSYVFCVNPEVLTPTPELVKSVFLKLITLEGVSFCVIDPFNQMTNDYKSFGGRTDQYLEAVLADFKRFAVMNDVYFWVVAHPNGTIKKITDGTLKGNYECPDVYNIAGGAMWSNKCDNILIYHRPFAQTAPDNPSAEIYTKKIKRKVVGKKGFFLADYDWKKRRFIIDGIDVIENALNEKRIFFHPSLNDLPEKPQSTLQPSTDFNEPQPISEPKQRVPYIGEEAEF
tara:strand:- start:154 stop:2088 length:1935 start_codon:yes stop_codon:yes gene_type:complete